MSKETRNLFIFFILTFFASYSSEFLIVFTGWNPFTAPGIIFFTIGSSAPAWVALIMVIFTYNKDTRRDYFRRCFSIKQIKLPYWAFIVLIFPVIFIFIFFLEALMKDTQPGMTDLKAYFAAPSTILLLLLQGFINGPGEEFGWRGYALDPILKRLGMIRGSLMLGFIWGVWHLLSFFIPQTWQGQAGFKFTGFWMFIIFTIGFTLMMTWVYLRTNRSILSAIMMHYFNALTFSITKPYSDKFWILSVITITIIGLLLCILERSKSQAVMVTLNEA